MWVVRGFRGDFGCDFAGASATWASELGVGGGFPPSKCCASEELINNIADAVGNLVMLISRERSALRPSRKAFSPKRGLIFTVNGASAPPPPPPIPRAHLHACPPPSWRTKPPRERGAGARGRGGGAIYRENEPPFRRKSLQSEI